MTISDAGVWGSVSQKCLVGVVLCADLNQVSQSMALFSDVNPRFITTIDDGWLVVLRVPDRDRVLTKTFRPQSDQMLEKALHWRDRAYRRLFRKPVPQRVFHEAPKDTATGMPGVRYLLKKVKKNQNSYAIPVIIAEVHTIPGKDYSRSRGSRSRLFSLNKYEWDEAVSLAAEWRREIVKALEKEPIN